jgi:hypothetical protein
MMDGDVSLMSQPGMGSTFKLTFRAADASSRKKEPVASGGRENRALVAGFLGLRILLVDDNAINRSVALCYLRRAVLS